MSVKHDILATLSYFDIFDYPVTQTEILQFLGNIHPQEDVLEGIHFLLKENWIYRLDEFYSLQENFSLATRRRQGNNHARKMLKTAERIAGFLSSFPFVKGVAVSGSLSKNFADEKSDIDFFIITATNKLWLARTFMHIFKKLTFLVRKQHLFCMNYYIDESRMQIKEKNIYTATEVVTLLPLRGIKAFDEFYSRNKWSRNFLPNHTMKVSYVKEAKSSILKKVIEFLLSNSFGNFLDRMLMKITAWRWKQKTRNRKLNMRGIVMSLDADRHFAKPNPENFQNKFIEAYEKKVFNLFRMYENRVKSIY